MTVLDHERDPGRNHDPLALVDGVEMGVVANVERLGPLYGESGGCDIRARVGSAVAPALPAVVAEPVVVATA
jgi:hypothetical protein